MSDTRNPATDEGAGCLLICLGVFVLCLIPKACTMADVLIENTKVPKVEETK